MKKEHKILLGGIIAVALLDAIGSVASRQLDFDYARLSYVSFVIYATTGFLATRTVDLKTGVIYGALLGFFDSTIGLKISMLLDANTGDFSYEQLTLVIWIITVVVMIVFGAIAGLIGGGLARLIRNKNTNVQQ